MTATNTLTQISRREFVVVALVCGAGCTSTQSDEVDPLVDSASEDLGNAEESLQTAWSRYRYLDNETTEAEKRGVNVSSSKATLGQIPSKMRELEQNVSSARIALNRAEYQAALEQSSHVLTEVERTNERLDYAESELEHAYTEAVRDAEQQLTSANREYQIAVAYVDSATEVGGDTEPLHQPLTTAREQLIAGVDAIGTERPNPAQARQHAANASELSRKIQTGAVTAAKRGIAETAIRVQSDRLSDQLAHDQLDTASDAVSRAEFEQAEHALLLAQYSEQVARYEEFARRIEREDGVVLETVLPRIQLARDAIRDNEVPEGDLQYIDKEVESTITCLHSLRTAEAEVAHAKESATWFAPVDTAAAEKRIETGKSRLSKGDYVWSCSHGDVAQELARKERSRVESRIAASVILRVTDALHDLLQQEGVITPSSTATGQNTVRPPDLLEIQRVSFSYTPPSSPVIRPLDFASPAIVEIEFVSGADGTSVQEPTVEFELEVDAIEECGTSCRSTTGTVTNTGTQPAHDVVLRLDVFTGDRHIWPGSESEGMVSLGTMQPGESRQLQRDINVGFWDGLAARNNGHVRLVLTIEYDGGVQVIEETRPI